MCFALLQWGQEPAKQRKEYADGINSVKPNLITIFLSGDVMTGRGIDQILAHPSDPAIQEPYVKDAREYVELARRAGGLFNYPVDDSYIWGDALQEWERRAPDLRVINLETSITTSSDFWRGKSIHYRMHPGNAGVLAAAKVDVCALANNHVLDFGTSGLDETLKTLERWKLKYAGAGRDQREASKPVVLETNGKRRIAVFSVGSESSGIPREWAATGDRAGVCLPENADSVIKRIQETTRPEDVVLVSIHWGSNWGYEIPSSQVELAHRLIDEAGADIVHGHSSHHVKGIEVYRNKLVLYGCGDFLNDYEGISGFEEFRGDLNLMYFVAVHPSGNVVQVSMVPTRMNRLKVTRASGAEALWLQEVLNREGRRWGTSVELKEDNSLFLHYR